MKNKIIAVSVVIVVLFCGIGYCSNKIINKNNSFQGSLDRKEMYPVDSLRYKFL